MNEAADSIETILENIGWPLLSEQKCGCNVSCLELVAMAMRGLTEKEDSAVMGLVHLLDVFQDYAESKGMWKFPEGVEDES